MTTTEVAKNPSVTVHDDGMSVVAAEHTGRPPEWNKGFNKVMNINLRFDGGFRSSAAPVIKNFYTTALLYSQL